MGTITRLTAADFADTTNLSTYTTPSFTPTAGRLLVVAVSIKSTTVALGATGSANSITFDTSHGIELATDASGSKAGIFPAGQLTPGSPSSMTISVTCTGDAGAGATISVYEVDDTNVKAGASAILQKAGTDNNIIANAHPAVSFAAAPQSGNCVLCQVTNNTQPAGQTPPSSPAFTEQIDTGYATPTTGTEVASIDSGAPQTITYSTTSTRGAIMAVEFDLSAPPAAGFAGNFFPFLGMQMVPALRPPNNWIVHNSSFEVDTSHWAPINGNAAISRVSGGYVGSFAARLSAIGAATFACVASDEKVPVIPGQYCTAEAYFKWATSATPGVIKDIRVEIRFFDATDTLVAAVPGSYETPNASTWLQRMNNDNIVPAGSTYAIIRCAMQAGDTGDACDFDAVYAVSEWINYDEDGTSDATQLPPYIPHYY